MIELPVIEGREKDAAEPTELVWRSRAQLHDEAAFAAVHAEELMPGASEAPEGSSRRQFLQVMGASMALAGLAACRRPEEAILPYARRPEEIIPGIPLYYATALPFRGIVRSVLVESHEGRPTKIEGNPEHPDSRGATSVFEQAAVLNLYDPDRSKAVLHEGSESSWADFVRFARQLAQQGEGLRLAVLAEPTSSPTTLRLRDTLRARYPGLRWITYAPEGDDASDLATRSTGGQSLRVVHDFSDAGVVVSLDADFLGPTDRNFISNTRTFTGGRRVADRDDRMSRLYVVESALSLTGGMADNRLRLRSSDVPAFAAALAARLGVAGADNSAAAGRFADHPFLEAIVSDVRRGRGNSVVVAGESQPPAVHAIVAAINASIAGDAVRYLATEQEESRPQADELRLLGAEIQAGRVDALLCLGTNPVYSAPAALAFDDLLRRVPYTLHHGAYVDETAQLCSWHVPAAHALEAWGDGRAFDGTASIIQPLIAPLYEDAHSAVELLNLFATGADAPGHDLVRETWQELGEQGWRRALHDGFIPDTAYPAANAPAAASPGELPVVGGGDLELVFRLDPSVLDGAYANNAWMQELPDPTTKIVWDNVATMSAATAERLGVDVAYKAGKFYADILEIGTDAGTIRVPAWIVPGHADDSIGLSLGYGRAISSPREHRGARLFDTDSKTDIYGSGPLANGVGTNVGPLRAAGFEAIRVGDVRVDRTGERMMVATTQEHGYTEGRPLARMATLDEYRRRPNFAELAVPTIGGANSWEEYPELWSEDHPKGHPAFKDSPYYQHQWGMVIDLNSCTGCNACIVACNSENNIQMVGKDQVSRGREMLWLRVDRYYVSPPGDGPEPEYDSVQMVMQPLPCMHCDNAPCESVCPVAATIQTPDGTNQMVYNRCIGTRYCSNNCPYKVRRFNFYNWSKTLPTQVQMQQNPNVTVRFRGVMEKCTFCVQRIREGNRREMVEGRRIEDGDVKTACQQVCPADAIVFGDLADPESRVSIQRRNPRRYEMLAELNTKPRTSYLARITNPNPDLRRTA